MSILVNSDTRVVVQGITGREGSFHTRQMLHYGTVVAAEMTPKQKKQKMTPVARCHLVSNIYLYTTILLYKANLKQDSEHI